MAIITVQRLTPESDTTATAKRSAGMAINPSMIRISTASRMRKKPAARPSGSPMATDISATPTPMISETRAP
jgi:hypothetical protein